MSYTKEFSSAPLLLLRSDAGPRIGMGHVMRGLGLAQKWQEMGGRAALLMGACNGPVEARFRREMVPVYVLNTEPGSHSDAAATAGEATRLGASWILADGYGFGTSWLAKVGQTGIPLGLWTDYLQATRLPVTLLLNQNPHACRSDYSEAASGATLLLGLRYAVLRREFRKFPNCTSIKGSRGIRRVLVTLGGSDPTNTTRNVLQSFALMGQSAPLATVVAGPNNSHLQELRELAAGLPSVKLLHAVEDMPALMDSCDLAISAGGATLWELAYLGVPALATILADNQVPLAAAISVSGAGIDLGWGHSLDPRRVADVLKILMSSPSRVTDMSSAALTLVDGQGAERVCNALLEHL